VIEGKNGTLVRGETMIEIPLPNGQGEIRGSPSLPARATTS
jgi:hypothetical protein